MKVMSNDHDMLEEYDLIHSVINNCACSAVGHKKINGFIGKETQVLTSPKFVWLSQYNCIANSC